MEAGRRRNEVSAVTGTRWSRCKKEHRRGRRGGGAADTKWMHSGGRRGEDVVNEGVVEARYMEARQLRGGGSAAKAMCRERWWKRGGGMCGGSSVETDWWRSCGGGAASEVWRLRYGGEREAGEILTN